MKVMKNNMLEGNEKEKSGRDSSLKINGRGICRNELLIIYTGIIGSGRRS